jgi:Flp pilus assembly protein TadG
MHTLFREISRFRRDKSGNIAIIFALTLLPIVSAIGCAVDFSLATRMRAKLQAAADSASVAAISQKSPGFTAAAAMTGNGSVTAGVTDANNVFDGNMSGITGYTNLSRTSTVTKTGIKLTSNVQFSADVPVVFMKVIGYQKLTVTGTAASAASLPPYLDFYLMLDVSGSMGLPSTDDEQTRLANVNPDNYTLYPNGCTFACHFSSQSCGNSTQKYNTNSHCLGYQISRVNPTAYANLVNQASTTSVPKQRPGLPNSMIPGLPSSLISGNANSLPSVSSCPTDGTPNCIQLRADAVGYAVTQLLNTANTSQKVTNQFRIGLYPFIRYLYSYFALTSSINGSPTNSSTINYAAANLATQLDTGVNANLGSGGTHFENAFPNMNTLITTVGDGSTSNNTQPFVFLVTDGAQNYQTQWGGGWSGSNSATVMNPTTLCKPLKDRGITISVLYIPYQPIQDPTSFANNEDFYANANIPYIPPSLLGCASPGFFFTANKPADITTALNAMFNMALKTAHITN